MIFNATIRLLRDVVFPTILVIVLSTIVITGAALGLVGTTVVVLLAVQKLPPAVLPYIAAVPFAITGGTIVIAPYILMRMKWKSESWKEAMIQGYVPWSALTLGIYALFSF